MINDIKDFVNFTNKGKGNNKQIFRVFLDEKEIKEKEEK